MAKTKEEVISWLKQHESPEPTLWRDEFKWEQENQAWIRHSQYIAVMMLSKMSEMNLSQRDLAGIMGCSQQYISKIVKGKENLSLETISKIESALGIRIIGPSPYNYIKDSQESLVADAARSGYKKLISKE